jgi:hypothetical protein
VSTAVAEATIEQRVEAGAAWLDERRPGWWKRTDLDALDIDDCTRCVLAQEWGDYFKAPIALDDAIARGFDSEYSAGTEEYALDVKELGAAWIDLIERRRAEAGAAP